MKKYLYLSSIFIYHQVLAFQKVTGPCWFHQLENNNKKLPPTFLLVQSELLVAGVGATSTVAFKD